MRANILFLSLAALLMLAACRQQQLTATDIQLEMSVSDMLVGETTLLVTVKDSQGNALSNPGKLSVRGDMDHAGMLPVLVQSETAPDGIFTLPFEWTMGGGWNVEASLALENGDVAVESFRFQILTEASEDDIAHANRSPIRGELSAAYMRISNRGETDMTIVAAASAAVELVEFHRTVVENDIARMEKLDGLLIPAGETVEFKPGGAHIMLKGLIADLLPGSQLALQLECDSGAVYDLELSVLDMLMTELDDAVEIGDLVFSNRWARPASAGKVEQADK